MTKKIKVRFHLGAGQNYLQWQVKKGNEVSYYKPDEVCIMMTGCKLRNHRGIAEKIHSGSNKTVCAWVECEQVSIYKRVAQFVLDFSGSTPIRYNPRVAPNWVDNDGNNIDNTTHSVIYSNGKGLFA